MLSFNLPTMVNAQPQTSQSQLTVEPEFWWADMQHNQLQLLVYGEDIREHSVNLTKANGVKLTSVVQSDSDNHLFINLDLANAEPQTITLTLEDKSGSSQSFSYQIKQREANSAQRQGFSNKDVIYLITPDRFVNGNPNNDVSPDMLEGLDRNFDGGRHGGDIEGIRKALPYLHELGVTQLWINPLLENNQAKYSYHGYSTTNFYKIDPRFGSNEEYKALVEQAKGYGIGIIKDVIVNHMGSGHRWMQDFPTSTWINHQQTWQQNPDLVPYTSHHRTAVQDPYAVKADLDDFEKGWFVPTMPDMNQNDPLMATYLIQNSIWWVEYAGLSGIREDTYSYADKAFLTRWSKALMTEYPNFNIVGEEWTKNPITVSYWQAGKQNADGYVSYTPSMMDFPVYEQLIEAINAKEDWGSGLITLYEALANDVVYADPTKLVLFEGNHDTNRLYSLVNEDIDLYEAALTYVLTSNRIPQIFYGTEVLMTSPIEGRHDGAVRGDFPGGWQGDAVDAFSGQGLSKAQNRALSFNRKLLNYRKNSLAIQQGSLKHFAPENGTYVQLRQHQDETLMVIYSKNADATALDLARFAAHIGNYQRAINIISDDKFKLGDTLEVSKGVTLLRLK
ncbi:alpha-amylase [Shewanella maritima]|uniref:Alpha-amylase n=1 Tax=Shewanella maritima TaxID=2520507 RepID=A0A411PMJ6_9GAMM|nr:alpha-amylase [Shewanella maritima]